MSTWCYVIYLFMHQFMYLCQRKKSFIKIPEVINIDFPQICNVEVNGAG